MIEALRQHTVVYSLLCQLRYPYTEMSAEKACKGREACIWRPLKCNVMRF